MKPRGTGRCRRWIALALATWTIGTAHAAATDEAVQSKVTLPGHLAPALARATPVVSRVDAKTAAHAPMTLTVVLRRTDPDGFETYLHDVYDPGSAQFRRFLSAEAIAERFGPSTEDYAAVQAYFEAQGFTLAEGSANRMTLTFNGERGQAERALDVAIADYAIDGRTVFANDREPSLPAGIASRVQAVAGLSDLGRPRASHQDLKEICTTMKDEVNNYFPFFAAFGLIAADVILEELANIGALGFVCVPGMVGEYAGTMLTGGNPRSTVLVSGGIFGKSRVGDEVNAKASALGHATGNGQRVGIVAFDNFHASDVGDFITLTSRLSTHPPSLANLSGVHVNGGAAIGPDESEVLLDIDTVMSVAPRAQVVVYDAPPSTSFQAVFNAMIGGGVTIISNSWASCEDQMSAADVQSLDAILATASASGIAVFSAAGDSGSTCLDGSANTVAVPADSPHVTAVGGSARAWASGFVTGTETWWDGGASSPPTGRGGFGTSRYFSRPAYQDGWVAGAMRSVPDVVDNADPATGMSLCQADAGGCPSGLLHGGTSMSAPAWAGYAALLNEAVGHNLGAFNAALYPLAGTSAFIGPAQLSSDFAHVGLGTPHPAYLKQKLLQQTTGAVDATHGWTTPLLPVGLLRHGTFAVPADGTTGGGIRVTLWDANGNLVPGKTVSLAANAGSHAQITPSSAVTSMSDGSVVFKVTDLVPETVTFTATDVTDGLGLPQQATLTFAVPPARNAGIVAAPTSVPSDGTSGTTITVTLTDVLGRPTPGKLITLSQGSAHAVVTGPSPAVTDANGRIQFVATDNVSETVAFTAVDATDADLPIPGTATVNFTGGTTSCITTPPAAATGYALTPFANGFVARNFFFGNINFTGCPGASNPAFGAGAVFAADFATGDLYRFASTGGAVSSANKLSNLHQTFGNLVFGRDGSLYATHFSPSDIVQIDPSTGAVLRTVASGFPCPGGLAVDPLSGDLFFDDNCTGGGIDNPSVWRVHAPASSSATVSVYASLPSTPGGQIAFAPDGTLYVVASAYNNNAMPIVRISGTNRASPPVVTTVAGITSDDGSLAIGAVQPDGSARSLIVHSAGALRLVDLTTTPFTTTTLATGSLSAGVIGPDGCLYANAHDTILKLAPSSGGCGFAPTNPAPALMLTPASVSPDPSQGGTQTLVASFRNLTVPAGTAVYFLVTGVNVQAKLARTDANGVAAMTYTGAFTGRDTIVARGDAGGTALTSNQARITWASGRHLAFLSLNASPTSGDPGALVTVMADLFDVTSAPSAAITGATVGFTLGSGTCNGVTDANGRVTCSMTVPAGGGSTLGASFAGNAQTTPASDAEHFSTIATALLPPGAPVIGRATAGPSQISVGFGAPSNDGGSAITAYRVDCTALGGGLTGTASGTGSPIVVTGLAGAATYTCTVVAMNAAGTGPASAASNPATPAGGPAAETLPIPTLDRFGLVVLVLALFMLACARRR